MIMGHARQGWKEDFLEALRVSGNMTWAARVSDVSRDTVHRHQKLDPTFRVEIEHARDAAYIRTGFETPRLHAGKLRYVEDRVGPKRAGRPCLVCVQPFVKGDLMYRGGTGTDPRNRQKYLICVDCYEDLKEITAEIRAFEARRRERFGFE